MKTNLILAILAALLAIPTTLSLLSERTIYQRPNDEPRLFEGFTKDAIAIVRVARQQRDGEQPKVDEQGQPVFDAAVFQLADGKWIVREGDLAGVPVIAGKVDSDLLDHLRRIRVDRERIIVPNANDEQLAERDLTEDKALLIEAYDREGKQLAKLLVGKDTSGGRYTEDAVPGFYVRRGDSQDIVHYDHEQAQFWNPSVKAEDWIEKRVHNFETKQVKELTLRNDKGSITFTRERAGKESTDADKWVAKDAPEGMGAVRQQEVQNLLARFSNFYAQRYLKPLVRVKADEKQQFGVGEKSDLQVTAVLDDETSHSVSFGKKIPDKQDYYAVATGSEFLLAVGEWDVTPYQRDPKEFFDPAPGSEQPKDGDKEPPNEQAPGEGDKSPPAEQGAGQPAEQPAEKPPEKSGEKSGEGAPPAEGGKQNEPPPPPAEQPPNNEAGTPPPTKEPPGGKSGTGKGDG